MRRHLNAWLPRGSARRWAAVGFTKSPLGFFLAFFRSARASHQLLGRITRFPIRLGLGQRLVIKRESGARVEFNGVLTVAAWGGGSGDSSITVGKGSVFRLYGDFCIGHNVHMSVDVGAELRIEGVRSSSGSGITCDSRIMAAQRIVIGADTIIAWGVFISDSDWHSLDGILHTEPVSVGDKVWIAHDCSILRGASVSSGSVVAAKSLVTRKFTEECVLLAGVPATVVRKDVSWAR